MTLIAAFQAPRRLDGPGGIALCADSQETITEYDEYGNANDMRVAVQKIDPIHRTESLHVAIAGSGNSKLIEGFITRASRLLAVRSDLKKLVDVRDALENELSRFYRNDVMICPDSKEMRLFVAVSCPESQEHDLWVSEYAVLKAPKFPSLVGWEHAVYTETATRLAARDLRLQQAVLASIYTLSLAKQTSNYVGGDLSVAIITSNGIWIENPEYVKKMSARLVEYEGKVNEVFLACADTSVTVAALGSIISKFGDVATTLHREQIDQQLKEMTWETIVLTNDPYPKLPLGTAIYFTEGKGATIAHEEELQRKLDADLQAEIARDRRCGYDRHLATHVHGDVYTLCTIDGKDQVVIDLGKKTKSEMLAFLLGHKMFPDAANKIMEMLELEGNKVTFPAPSPTQSSFQKS